MRNDRVDAEVRSEMEFHLEMARRELEASGLSPERAREEALRRFGNLDSVGAECRKFGRERDRRRARGEYLHDLRQDMVFAWRQLLRAHGFAVIAILTLALGIGATAAVFSALDAVALRALPYADPDRIVQIEPEREGRPLGGTTNAEFAAFRDAHQTFSTLAALIPGSGYTLTGDGPPQVVDAEVVSADYFRVFGVSPAIGRGFVQADDEPGSPLVVVLSNALWRSRFHGDQRVLGRTIRLDDEPYTVIGIMPASFDLSGTGGGLWTTLRLSSASFENSDGRYLHIIARLRPGVTPADAARAVRVAERAIRARHPELADNIGADVRRYADTIVGDTRTRLVILLGAVGLVLLIACVNVSNLLLARASVRSTELAIRAALGAGRARLVRQLLAESAVLVGLGATAGIALAYALLRAVVATAPANVPRLADAHIDGTVLMFTLGVAVVCSVLVGLLPAVRGAATAIEAHLRAGGRGTAGAVRDRVRGVLVGAEVALAIALLAGAGLLIRTSWALAHVELGFSPSHVLAARILLPEARYEKADDVLRAFREIVDQSSRIPGVVSAALSSTVPLSGSSMHAGVQAEDHPVPMAERTGVSFDLISPRYFTTMRIPILDGRDVSASDDASAPSVVVVSASLAQRLWPGQRAIGKRIDALSFAPGTSHWMQVVGVVGDVRHAGLATPPEPAMYLPYTQAPAPTWPILHRSLVVVTRTADDPRAHVAALKEAVLQIDPSLPLADDNTLDEYVDHAQATTRSTMLLLSSLGALALLLASVGVYGAVSYFVSQRRQEIGVRMALGATPRRIWRLVLVRAMAPVGGGALVGIAIALAATRILQGQLYGVATTDPPTLVAVTVLLVGVGVIAAYVPARRAMRLPPASALQSS